MIEKRKLKLKKFYFHPITVFTVATLFLIVLTWILSKFQLQATYSIVDPATAELESKLVTIENLLTYDGMKELISYATKNFVAFAPLSMLLISLIGISIAEATGFVETLSKRVLKKIPKKRLTFLILFIATISSLINDVGYAILIPLVAIIYEINGRNPMLGIITAFCGVAFSSGVSIFVGWSDINLIPYTTSAARLIDANAHISLTSNLIFIIVASIVIPIVGTFIIEKLIAPKLGKYHFHDRTTGETLQTSELMISDIEDAEQNKIIAERNEKRGLRYVIVTTIITTLVFAYMLIPNLPASGLLLDMNEKIYVNQLFGNNSYFHLALTFITTLYFVIAGLAYGIGAKTLKNDRDIIEKTTLRFKDIGSVIVLLFVFSQFIAVWKASNLDIIITALCANLLSYLNFTSVILILTALVVMGFAGIFCSSLATKWKIFAPVVVPLFMQSNISPQFAQIVMRVSDSMTKGVTPFMAFFVIYVGYLNLFNENKQKPYTINNSIRLIAPYFVIIGLTWIVLILAWYIIGIPIGPKVSPTI